MGSFPFFPAGNSGWTSTYITFWLKAPPANQEHPTPLSHPTFSLDLVPFTGLWPQLHARPPTHHDCHKVVAPLPCHSTAPTKAKCPTPFLWFARKSPNPPFGDSTRPGN